MSALGQKQTLEHRPRMSALPPIADILGGDLQTIPPPRVLSGSPKKGDQKGDTQIGVWCKTLFSHAILLAVRRSPPPPNTRLIYRDNLRRFDSQDCILAGEPVSLFGALPEQRAL